MRTLSEIQLASYENSKAHGFWDGPENDNIPTKLALIHAEISEALEEYRDGNMDTRFADDGKPEGFGVELADAIIRIADLAGRLDINLEYDVLDKMDYNATRPHMHGGKRV